MCLSLCLSVSLYVSLSLTASLSQSLSLSLSQFSVSLSLYLSVFLSLCLSVCFRSLFWGFSFLSSLAMLKGCLPGRSPQPIFLLQERGADVLDKLCLVCSSQLLQEAFPDAVEEIGRKKGRAFNPDFHLLAPCTLSMSARIALGMLQAGVSPCLWQQSGKDILRLQGAVCKVAQDMGRGFQMGCLFTQQPTNPCSGGLLS